jgi:hypothetical protein
VRRATAVAVTPTTTREIRKGLLEEMDGSGAAADVRLRLLIDAFVHTILDELHGTALFLDLEALSPAHVEAVIGRRDTFDRGVRRVLEEGMAAGVFARAPLG